MIKTMWLKCKMGAKDSKPSCISYEDALKRGMYAIWSFPYSPSTRAQKKTTTQKCCASVRRLCVCVFSYRRRLVVAPLMIPPTTNRAFALLLDGWTNIHIILIIIFPNSKIDLLQFHKLARLPSDKIAICGKKKEKRNKNRLSSLVVVLATAAGVETRRRSEMFLYVCALSVCIFVVSSLGGCGRWVQWIIERKKQFNVCYQFLLWRDQTHLSVCVCLTQAPLANVLLLLLLTIWFTLLQHEIPTHLCDLLLMFLLLFSLYLAISLCSMQM